MIENRFLGDVGQNGFELAEIGGPPYFAAIRHAEYKIPEAQVFLKKTPYLLVQNRRVLIQENGGNVGCPLPVGLLGA